MIENYGMCDNQLKFVSGSHERGHPLVKLIYDFMHILYNLLEVTHSMVNERYDLSKNNLSSY